MTIALRSIAAPAIEVPLQQPAIPGTTYAARCNEAYRRAGHDWLVIYADREHNANIMFMSGFDPRFEEALLLLGPGEQRIFVVGNEDESYTAISPLPGKQVMLAQSMSLLAQDRSRRPSVEAVLRECGIKSGDSVGVVGWKYFEGAEWDGEEPGLFVPAYLPILLKRITGQSPAEATPVLMHETEGLRSVVDADQIAAYEWGAARASAAVWRMVTGIQAGDSELLAASRMGYAGEPMNCHPMLTTSDASGPVIGLSSPTGRIIGKGNGISAAVSFWGGLASRAGLVTDHDEAFLATAKSYFEGLITWYETADLGVTGGEIHDAVTGALARGGLGSALNPGHLTGHDEWLNSPVRPGSQSRIASGMPFQIDVIPVPMPNGWALNCEDAVTFADAKLREELRTRHPQVYTRIEQRRAFMRDELGVAIHDAILPMSSTPLCLPPFWLASNMLLARA
ncbi:M24 family metallopeptidase [Devosia sp. 1566]|uniref:M24 family metallopeptidase n=1 Tax=Devosia sp. 1566 TaxID=2499144 RepID=UPI000FD9455B|nr:M24 family metallopeptidase [Devosia sp. 1566]